MPVPPCRNSGSRGRKQEPTPPVQHYAGQPVTHAAGRRELTLARCPAMKLIILEKTKSFCKIVTYF